ncbi:MAG TPA: hypothetical protein V6D17_15170 [Candidatus Obscuribacterales bacterium]
MNSADIRPPKTALARSTIEQMEIYLHVKNTRKFRKSRGQGIAEYGAMLAFVCVLVALAFSFAPGRLLPAVSEAYGAVVSQLNDLTNTASSGS